MVEVDNVEPDQKLPVPLQPKDLEETEEKPEEPTTSIWNDLISIGINIISDLTKNKYPTFSTTLRECEITISENLGYLLNKYVPVDIGISSGKEIQCIIALGFVGLTLFSAYKKDVGGGQAGHGDSKGIS